ncbi:NADPH:quinone reductase and related Zn-dependent oxidoreductases, related [Neospora caninum Liverpool]|uniref:NADPH:quinone reductase and related Zn-dependent oxidoreductases, related n=1 Tax=Neospora caninum (strain Liverpool) TaxID=572307 RepID=F0VEK0_NEOCL|nr:NADPH:quinone reductase and related Zn-dependent oxidoreductases, related [Neospora caninum Liverpool]CBZ52144.1 NADPH:quinone reductase and related Zn-dependent oxidoreductases, related [Neospora caninum Liverpool]|eukprot:XP_003882176.1 NADPH:quinone reductase and related Zn-dependent oxidoreductases, related [Neospora caninum Liverpool]
MRAVLVEASPPSRLHAATKGAAKPAFRLVLGSAAKPTPKKEKKEILIQVKAAGVNRMDLLQKRGKYPPPLGASPILGPEAAGIVASSGNRFREGDRVMALLLGGGYAEYVAVEEGLCMPIPDSLSFAQAAAIPENWLTAYQLLHFVAGVGTALVQLSSLLAIPTVIASAGSDEKLRLCRALGATHVINYRALEGKFAEEVSKATNGDGADLLLDPVGASFMKENAKCCAVDASWVLYGGLGGVKVPEFDFQPFFAKRIRLLASTLRSQDLSYREMLVKSFEVAVLPKLADGSLKVILDSTYPASEADQAHERLETNANCGKVVLTFDEPVGL